MVEARGDVRRILREQFGFLRFRPGQEQAVKAAMEGRDTLVIMPTGSGKSLCFQLPALALEGTTVVVSPLIALMKDQADALQERGVEVAAIPAVPPVRSTRRTTRSLRGDPAGPQRVRLHDPRTACASGVPRPLESDPD